MKAIVAGSEGLIGKYVVTNLLSEGYDVVCVDYALGHDLRNEEFVKEFFCEHRSNHLINTFAFNDHVKPGEKRGTLYDLSLASFRDCLDVNVTALFSVCREYAFHNQGGNIVNFGASTGIVSARPDMYNGAHKHVGYSVSKAAVIHMTKILAAHMAPHVRVNCISPGGVESDQTDAFKALYGSYAPMGRMCKLHEILPAVKFLLDPGNSYVTGANIIVDGGWTIV